jgi:hypothetical protein
MREGKANDFRSEVLGGSAESVSSIGDVFRETKVGQLEVALLVTVPHQRSLDLKSQNRKKRTVESINKFSGLRSR